MCAFATKRSVQRLAAAARFCSFACNVMARNQVSSSTAIEFQVTTPRVQIGFVSQTKSSSSGIDCATSELVTFSCLQELHRTSQASRVIVPHHVYFTRLEQENVRILMLLLCTRPNICVTVTL